MKCPHKGDSPLRKQKNCKGGTPNRIYQLKPKSKGIEALFAKRGKTIMKPPNTPMDLDDEDSQQIKRK